MHYLHAYFNSWSLYMYAFTFEIILIIALPLLRKIISSGRRGLKQRWMLFDFVHSCKWSVPSESVIRICHPNLLSEFGRRDCRTCLYWTSIFYSTTNSTRMCLCIFFLISDHTSLIVVLPVLSIFTCFTLHLCRRPRQIVRLYSDLKHKWLIRTHTIETCAFFMDAYDGNGRRIQTTDTETRNTALKIWFAHSESMTFLADGIVKVCSFLIIQLVSLRSLISNFVVVFQRNWVPWGHALLWNGFWTLGLYVCTGVGVFVLGK